MRARTFSAGMEKKEEAKPKPSEEKTAKKEESKLLDELGYPNGPEITNKDTVLKEVDAVLGVNKPPAIEYLFVEVRQRSIGSKMSFFRIVKSILAFSLLHVLVAIVYERNLCVYHAIARSLATPPRSVSSCCCLLCARWATIGSSVELQPLSCSLFIAARRLQYPRYWNSDESIWAVRVTRHLCSPFSLLRDAPWHRYGGSSTAICVESLLGKVHLLRN